MYCALISYRVAKADGSPGARIMEPTKSYTEMKESCKFCGAKRDGKRGLICADCRTDYNRLAQSRHRQKERVRVAIECVDV